MRYTDHIHGTGTVLLERVCEKEVGASRYSQMIGLAELFQRDRHREPVPGWHACELARAGSLS